MTPECAIDIEMPIIPILEPMGDNVPAEFAYNRKVRDWWMRVANEECQVETYTESHGFVQCPNDAEHVHHLTPESWQLAHGDEPEKSTALPACKTHHVSKGTGNGFEGNFSFHEDMGQAYEDYRKGDIDAFRRTSRQHQELAKEGVVFWNDDADDYYTRKMKEKAERYTLEHPNDPKPQVKPHSKYDPKKKKHWYDGFFEGGSDD